jgi:hypothetical protein
MTDHFSNMQETDTDNIDKKSDFMLLGFIMILIAIVIASYFALYPDESKLKTGTAVEKPDLAANTIFSQENHRPTGS